MRQTPIYLDNNATTPLLPEVREMLISSSDLFANPGSNHSFGRDARVLLDESRSRIAASLDCDVDEVIFTSGGSESINAAIHGFTDGREGTIALTAGEHPAVSAACRRSCRAGFSEVQIPVDSAGRIVSSAFNDLPWDSLRLCCVILAHNETGVIQDLRPLAERCTEHHVPLLVDAVQAVGKIPVSFRTLQCTALAFGAHKFHGPRGIGGLILRRGVRMAPLLVGGHQEGGRRAGTEPVPLIAAMAEALCSFTESRNDRMKHSRTLRDQLEVRLLHGFPDAVIHGLAAERLPNTLSIAFPGIDGEALLVNLHLEGIACSLGSTCASGSAEPAPALLAMGVSPELCRSSVRFSVGALNTADEVTEAASRITAVVHRMRGIAGNRSE